MESNNDTIQYNGDNMLDDNVVNLSNGKINSESEDDDDTFFNQLFTGVTPKYEATDTVPWLDDSDSDTGAPDLLIKFYVDKSNSVPLALYDGTEYRIGFLDLTQNEYSCLVIMAETTVELSVNERHIHIYHNKFNIKRINERQVTTNQDDTIELCFKKLDLVRLQFSTIEPFLVKYEEKIYFAGRKLSGEYASLLHRTKKSAGTAIRIRRTRLNVDKLNQILDINYSHSFNKQTEFCVIAGSEKRPNEQTSNDYHRYMIWSNPCLFLAIESSLMNSSYADDCCEIYAEIDFPFFDSERILSTETNPSSRRELRKNEDKQKEIREIKERKEKIGRREKEVKEKEKKEKKKKEKKSRKDAINEKNTINNTATVSAGSDALKMLDLQTFEPCEEYRQIFAKMSGLNRSSLYAKKLDTSVHFDLFISYKEDRRRPKEKRHDTYFKQRTIMLFMEEIEHSNYLNKFDGTAVQLSHYKDLEFGFPITEELCELVAEIEQNGIDQVILRPINKKLGKPVKGKICGIRGQQIIIEIYATLIDRLRKLYENELYTISYKVNRQPYQMQHHAWEYVDVQDIFVRLIDNTAYRCKSPKIYLREHNLKQSGTMLERLNAGQQLAIKNFLTRKTQEPYILIGPPGTGKTQTLIALIEQIVRTDTQNVLICAPSNVSCDAITERLLDVIKKDELFRFYGDSCKYVKTSRRIQEVSNINLDEVFYPPLKFLYSFRVIICTTSSAGYLTRARLDGKWSAAHFGYVIIDDCASIPQSMSLIPIAGLCTMATKIFAKMMLAGDVQQLPVKTRSNLAREMGFSKSLIEELCETFLYSRNEETGQLNNMFITQLMKNYRSHPDIVRIENELFYKNAMQPLAEEDDLNQLINSKILPSKKLIFKSVLGTCSHSSNEDEIQEVIHTIEEILQKTDSGDTEDRKVEPIKQSDIGVITPSITQSAKIAQKLRALNINEVAVGTAEDFQGTEKFVMIVSTVITDGDLGVVASLNWMNFVMNRGRSLVVIIGNSETLKVNENWNKIIEFCMQC